MTLLTIIGLALAFAALFAASWLGAAMISSAHPSDGRTIDVVWSGTTAVKIHYVELGSREAIEANAPPIVLLHGASGNLEDMRMALGTRLAQHHRVILIDRPGHGRSTIDGDAPLSLATQAMLLARSFDQLGLQHVTLVGHSLGGALALAVAREAADRVAGLVLLAPVSYPWPGGISWYYTWTTVPIVGRLFAYTLALPVGSLLLPSGVREAFAPQSAPADYVATAQARMVLRPREFLANAHEVVQLREFVTAQATRYGEISVPAAIVTGDADTVVSPRIHALALAKVLPRAKLVVLPGIGHMLHHVATDSVVAAIEDVVARAR